MHRVHVEVGENINTAAAGLRNYMKKGSNINVVYEDIDITVFLLHDYSSVFCGN